MADDTWGNRRWYADNFETLTEEECLDLLGSRPVGRIAYVADGWPVVLPVNHVVDGTDVVVRISPHAEVARHTLSGRVAFEVDAFDEDTRTGWSVLVRGTAEYDDPLVPRPEASPEPWADGSRHLVVRIRPSMVSGRRLRPR